MLAGRWAVGAVAALAGICLNSRASGKERHETVFKAPVHTDRSPRFPLLLLPLLL